MNARADTSPALALDRLEGAICRVMGCEPAEIFASARGGHRAPAEARGAAAYLARTDLGLSWLQIAGWLGISQGPTAFGLAERFAERHGLPSTKAAGRPGLATAATHGPAGDGSLEAEILALFEVGDDFATAEIAERCCAGEGATDVILRRLRAAGALAARDEDGETLWTRAEPGSAARAGERGGALATTTRPSVPAGPLSPPNPRAPFIAPTAPPAVAILLTDRVLQALENRAALTTVSMATMLGVKESLVCRALSELRGRRRVAADPLGEGGLRAQLWRVRGADVAEAAE